MPPTQVFSLVYTRLSKERKKEQERRREWWTQKKFNTMSK
jgi:hypothetical protein